MYMYARSVDVEVSVITKRGSSHVYVSVDVEVSVLAKRGSSHVYVC
jgi:hypothetical protein